VSDADLSRSRFGDYEIVDELGRGGMGKVYRARDVSLERIVALNVLPANLARDPTYVQRFVKEARAAARLNHPNIVQIYNFGSIEGTYYLAMEFVDGRSLGSHLKERRFTESETIGIARQVCRALAVAHAEGLIHRDIKPDNLMLTSRGEVKLVDLGIAKRLDEDQAITQTGHSMGTPHYISPEQIRGQKDIDARADIYSLGATLYHLVTGQTPFKGASGAVVMSMHLVEPLPDPLQYAPGLSEGFCRVLRKMMAKDRQERYPDVAALEVDLFRLHVGQTPRPNEPTAPVFQSTADATVQLGAPQTAVFDPVVLLRIEEHLAASIGPMARILVRKSARTAPSLDALCEELSRHVDPGSRDAFLATCRARGRESLAAGRTPAGGAATSLSPPPRTSMPSSSDPGASRIPSGVNEPDLALLETALAQQIGPLARLLLKKALKNAATLSGLASTLEENIPGEEGRRAFREAVRKLTS